MYNIVNITFSYIKKRGILLREKMCVCVCVCVCGYIISPQQKINSGNKLCCKHFKQMTNTITMVTCYNTSHTERETQAASLQWQIVKVSNITSPQHWVTATSANEVHHFQQSTAISACLQYLEHFNVLKKKHFRMSATSRMLKCSKKR